ncbi:catalase family peroxidase [Psychrobium sp. MM17-31]|uniref:catalase family peroxidase n=1 Tax=Psychrobium sp. MM17-31 TaxID=2917758 RepID=UPI001EF56D0B|nr:catalase family peroxidase [Psychrobium sp. MM17-31]MCG7531083.1 catalase family peroxidase [Psychrobium sp. MM17-31]
MQSIVTFIGSGMLLAGAITGQSAIAQEQEKVQAIDFIKLFQQAAGENPGQRKAHTKGVCAKGEFQPIQTTEFSSSSLLTNGTLPATVRFSMGGGNPKADEREPGIRGIGVKLSLPNGSQHIFTGINAPVFAGKEPSDFFGLLKALSPDESGSVNQQKLAAYIAAHPSVAEHVKWATSSKTPTSYANTKYHGLHTFFYEQNNKMTKFRWQLIPQLGVTTYSKTQAEKLPPHFLEDTLIQQAKQQTVTFDLIAQLGMASDTNNDPSQQWPTERPTVKLGTIKLNSAGDVDCQNINFDPNVLSSGFSPSDDPILRMRSAAYAISFGKRLAGQ